MVRQSAGRSVPVVMIVLDELPLGTLLTERGEIDPTLFPNLARFARTSTWFRNTTTPAPFTLEALPSMLRGVPERLPHYSDGLRVKDLFTLLGSRYPIRTSGPPRWCDPRLCRPHSTSVPLEGDFHLFSSADRGRDLGAFLELLEDRPTGFFFMHLAMPHGPLRYLPSGQRYPEADGEPGEVNPPGRGRAWGPYPWLVKLGFQRHLLQTMLTDRALGLIFDRLERLEMFDKSLVIVAADHGLGFVPGETKRTVTAHNLGHIAPVPMLIKRPGQRRGHVSPAPVETTDLPATVADALRLKHGPDGDGSSMFDASLQAGRARYSDGVPISPVGNEVMDLVRFKYAAFRRAGRSIDPFSIAPPGAHHLIGDAVGEAPSGSLSAAMNLGALERARRDDKLFPALIEGRVLGEVGRDPLLAIVVNRRIAAVTRTTHLGGAARFFALLDPNYFAPAAGPVNRIEIFEVEGDGLRKVRIHADAGILTDALLDLRVPVRELRV